jgi:hypothetical protein
VKERKKDRGKVYNKVKELVSQLVGWATMRRLGSVSRILSLVALRI